MHRANYWIAVFTNSVFPSLYLATAVALVLGVVFHRVDVFLITFVALMSVGVPYFMWLYHNVIWPRRKRRRQTPRS
jgi:hypothetical protein